MNMPMVRTLILKDWYFLRIAIACYLAAGFVALLLVAQGTDGASFIGSVLLLTVVIAVGFHLAMQTVEIERTEHTLPFIMSLPVSPMEYTTAKILANVLIFLVPWLTLLAGAVTVILLAPESKHGVLPFTVVILAELFAGYCMVLAVALVSESQGWTIGAIVFTNLFFQGFLYWVSHIPAIAAQMKGSAIVWSGPAGLLLAGELAVILLLLGATFYLQSRKKDFL